MKGPNSSEVTLRDRFAIEAVAPVLSQVRDLSNMPYSQIASLASLCYVIADAMLVARKIVHVPVSRKPRQVRINRPIDGE